MNVLLVRPRPDKETIGLQNVMICEPLELEYIGAYIQPLGHNVTIVDMILEKLSHINSECSVLLLGRYQKDIYKIDDKNDVPEIWSSSFTGISR